jgi:hypothetical protein
MGKKLPLISLALILLLWIAPLLLALAAGGVASVLGCEANEGAAHPCILFSSDIGETIYTFSVLGWLTIIGIPFLGIALVVWVIAVLVAQSVARRRKAS